MWTSGTVSVKGANLKNRNKSDSSTQKTLFDDADFGKQTANVVNPSDGYLQLRDW